MERTSEARLLELIKGGGRGHRREAWRNRAGRLALVLRARAGQGTPWQWTNRFLAAAFLFLAFGALRAWMTSPRSEAALGADPAAAAPAAPQRSTEASLSDLTRRNLFRPLVAPPPPAPREEAPPAPPPVPKVPLRERASVFRLSGILPGDTPQAIIEDRRRNSTRYLAAGDMLDDIKVEKVLSDRVILSADGETTDLSL